MSLPIKPFRVNEIIAEIRKVNPKKSAGYYNIDAEVLKNMPKKALNFPNGFVQRYFRAITFSYPVEPCKNYNG